MFISTYNNENYVLLKINIKENNREISLDDIIYLSKTPIYQKIEKKNYFIIWKTKKEVLEKYINEHYNIYDYDFNYYDGLSYNSINIVKNINYLNISYGISFRRFYRINTIYELYDPFNIEIGPIVNSIVEFIKYQFFYKNKKINIDKIFSLNLNREDYYYLVARLLFPTYYYDLFKNDRIINDYYLIINNIDNYIQYIKEIIINIKKRHKQMPLLDYIINLL